MITQEPVIKVGIIEHARHVRGTLNGTFLIAGVKEVTGAFEAAVDGATIAVTDGRGNEIFHGTEIFFSPKDDRPFVLHDVVIGIHFHWERKESQTFQGGLRLCLLPDKTITAINEIPVERYLASVISSEMSATAPEELLKAHAITSRSWLVAMLEQKKKYSTVGIPAQRTRQNESELVRWYDREDHDIFDVCADDHCQRYQGMSKILSAGAESAVRSTRGIFLVYENKICDARFYKACGGLTELFENAWDDTPVPYLRCVSDSAISYPPLRTEQDAERWIRSSPEAYCNTTDGNILRQILPSFDQETTDFYRWKVQYEREELEQILLKKSGVDFGTLQAIVPLKRGPSGRIFKLRIEGSKKTLIVGKELEIRRWLSKSHLYSSAFVVDAERDATGAPKKFIFYGAGWGHGVGLCQIGAAVMAVKGFKAEQIVTQYFKGASLLTLY